MTVLVAAFSVWLAPALTRQWDDRQKARELQAALAQDVAASTAKAVGVALAVLTGTTESRKAAALAQGWDAERSRLQATLRVYYPPSVIAQWYETSMNIADLYTAAPNCRKILMSSVGEPRYYGISYEGELTNYLTHVFYEPSAELYEEPSGASDRGFKQANDYAKWVMNVRKIRPPEDFLATLLSRSFTHRINKTLLGILETRPQGFSTTRGDLLRDLLP